MTDIYWIYESSKPGSSVDISISCTYQQHILAPAPPSLPFLQVSITAFFARLHHRPPPPFFLPSLDNMVSSHLRLHGFTAPEHTVLWMTASPREDDIECKVSKRKHPPHHLTICSPNPHVCHMEGFAEAGMEYTEWRRRSSIGEEALCHTLHILSPFTEVCHCKTTHCSHVPMFCFSEHYWSLYSS